MSKRNPSGRIIKELFADSKGICAECNKELFPDGTNIAEICHIEAFSSAGSRFNKTLKIAGKENEYKNLIVLCANCHIKIDTKGNEKKFDVNYLQTLKENHKKKSLIDTSEEFNEKATEEITNKFELSIESELAEIKYLLKSIIGNNCFKLLKDEFKRTNSFRASFENINSFFFSISDKETIDTIKRGVELELPQSYILEGPPSSGKTSLIIKLASEISTFTSGIIEYYVLSRINPVPIYVYNENNYIIYIFNNGLVYDYKKMKQVPEEYVISDKTNNSNNSKKEKKQEQVINIRFNYSVIHRSARPYGSHDRHLHPG
ncbi:HNH endonuclease signature motif containing protein, partial [Ferruginibacter sp.]